MVKKLQWKESYQTFFFEEKIASGFFDGIPLKSSSLLGASDCALSVCLGPVCLST